MNSNGNEASVDVEKALYEALKLIRKRSYLDSPMRDTADSAIALYESKGKL